MRKILLSLLLSCFGVYAMGQAPIIDGHQLSPVSPKALQGFKPNLRSTPWTHWFNNYTESKSTGFENYILYNNTVFSDSTVQVLYGDGNGGTQLGYVFTQGVGEVLDPKAEIYDTALSRYNPYTIDSVALPYLYNYVPEVDSNSDDLVTHDTLIFQFYTGNSGGITKGVAPAQLPSFPYPEYYALTKYDYKKNLGTLAIGTVKYVLGQKDSQSVLTNVIQVATNGANGIKVQPGDLFAFTVSYRPGFKYSFGDTIDEKSPVAPKNLHSHFKILIGNTGSKEQNADYENSLNIVSSVRYNTNTNGWNGQYIPGSVWLSYNQILWSFFHATTPNLGVQQSGDLKGYEMGNIYPNPNHGNARLDFALGHAENVTIKVYDILGHEMATLADGIYTSGNHSINFSTAGYKTGVYLYSITAGSFTKTMKFSVTE